MKEDKKTIYYQMPNYSDNPEYVPLLVSLEYYRAFQKITDQGKSPYDNVVEKNNNGFVVITLERAAVDAFGKHGWDMIDGKDTSHRITLHFEEGEPAFASGNAYMGASIYWSACESRTNG